MFIVLCHLSCWRPSSEFDGMVRETSKYRCGEPPTAGCPISNRLMDDILIGCHLFDTASVRQAFPRLFWCDGLMDVVISRIPEHTHWTERDDSCCVVKDGRLDGNEGCRHSCHVWRYGE